VSGGKTLRAPSDDGAVVAIPPLTEAGNLLALNRQRLQRPACTLLGQPLPELQRLARQELMQAARTYLAARGEPLPPLASGPLLLAGHQPELFHPGVWVKSFALNGLARQHGGTPVNLLIDNDTLKSASLRLPAPPGPGEPFPYLQSVPFDRWTSAVPFEEQVIQDPELFDTFAARAGAVLAGWDMRPMLPAFWAEVRGQTRGNRNLGEGLAGARRVLERAWGCHNLEVPLSAVCATEAFAWFAGHLLAELPRLHSLYNAIVRDYRRRHGIKGRHHPVPDLAEQDGWLEAPLWGWRRGEGRRGRLFARPQADRLELRSEDDLWPALPLAAAGGPERLVETWRQLEPAGYKVRTRALTTTLLARLLLGDLFLHGIGGGKYDELTDELCRQFLGLEPPEYLVLSATRLLPLPAPAVSAEDCRRLHRLLRDMDYNPDRYLTQTTLELEEALRSKRDWVARQPADAAWRRERFGRIRALNEVLRAPLDPDRQRLREQLALVRRQLEAAALLRRRDYAFCLYPEATLQPFCSQFL